MTTIAEQIVRIQTAIANAYTACQDMGATMPAILNSDNLEQCIASITGGGSSATVLHLYDRVDGKATVAGFWTDGNGQRYAVCVVDAAYRSGSGMGWGQNIDTPLPNYSSSSSALAAGESGTWNTDTILDNYTATDYPAFNFARSACTVTVDNQTFESCLPNLKELDILYQDKATLDTYDSTLSNYSTRSLSMFKCGGTNGLWSSTEVSSSQCYVYNASGSVGFPSKDFWNKNLYGVCPVFEIPVDENGEVQ